MNGIDTNPGTSAEPLKTIGWATQVCVTAGDRIYVRPGTYSTFSGESASISVSPGVALIGNESELGGVGGLTPTRLSGVGVSLQNDTEFAGFWINDNSGRDGVNILGTRVEVRNNSIYESERGIQLLVNKNGARIIGNLITQNNVGINIVNSDPLVENNRIFQNIFQGIYNAYTVNGAGQPDFGGGLQGSAGNNEIYCNGTGIGNSVDLFIDNFFPQVRTINAQNNEWDHVPPTLKDIVRINTIVKTTGAMFASDSPGTYKGCP